MDELTDYEINKRLAEIAGEGAALREQMNVTLAALERDTGQEPSRSVLLREIDKLVGVALARGYALGDRVRALTLADGEGQEGKRHRWSRDGERCLDCGDKDWMAGPVCNAPATDDGEETST